MIGRERSLSHPVRRLDGVRRRLVHNSTTAQRENVSASRGRQYRPGRVDGSGGPREPRSLQHVASHGVLRFQTASAVSRCAPVLSRASIARRDEIPVKLLRAAWYGAAGWRSLRRRADLVLIRLPGAAQITLDCWVELRTLGRTTSAPSLSALRLQAFRASQTPTATNVSIRTAVKAYAQLRPAFS